MRRTTDHRLWELEMDYKHDKAYLNYYIGKNTIPLPTEYSIIEISIYKYKQLSDLMGNLKEHKYRTSLLSEEIDFQINKIIKKDN